MADYEDDASGLHPALAAFRSSFSTPVSKAWATEAALRVQHYWDRQEAADTARQSGENFVGNLDTFKNGLVGLAAKDPTSMDMALSLVPHTVDALMGAHPDPNAAELHGPALTSHIQGEIARAGVQSYALVDDKAARAALDRYGSLLSDDTKSNLEMFIGTMATARQADAAAQTVENARQVQSTSDRRAHEWVGALSDPETGDVRLPPNWLRNVTVDPAIKPDAKQALWNVHHNLSQGDVVASDPAVASDLVSRLASPSPPGAMDVLSHAGDGLTLADARMLSAIALDPRHRPGVAALDSVLSEARERLAAPENGAAGEAAYGRFVNWMLPAARNGAILDPAATDYVLGGNRLQQFAPRAEDAAAAAVGSRPAQDRPSLRQIFAGGGPLTFDQSPQRDDGERFGEPYRSDHAMEHSGEGGSAAGSLDPMPLMSAPPGTYRAEDQNI